MVTDGLRVRVIGRVSVRIRIRGRVRVMVRENGAVGVGVGTSIEIGIEIGGSDRGRGRDMRGTELPPDFTLHLL